MAKFSPKLFQEDAGTPDAQEERLARAVGGRKQPGSGSSIYAKGDVKERSSEAHDPNRFLWECKQTIHKSLSIKGEWLDKISKEAIAAGLEPALSIEIKGMESNVAERDWVVLPLSVFKRLCE